MRDGTQAKLGSWMQLNMCALVPAKGRRRVYLVLIAWLSL